MLALKIQTLPILKCKTEKRVISVDRVLYLSQELNFSSGFPVLPEWILLCLELLFVSSFSCSSHVGAQTVMEKTGRCV